MGWAKYAEDNLELMLDRQYMREEKPSKPTITVLPATQWKPTVIKAEKEEVFEDKLIYCRACGNSFLFTASAQKVYKEKGWVPPKKCKCCREKRKALHLMQPTF